MEKRNSAKGTFKRVKSLMISILIAVVLFPGFTLLLSGAILLSLSLKLLELLGIEISSFGLRVLWHNLVFFKSEVPPNYKEVPEEVH
ncbi:hypothetical protein Theam_0041 [Thermovibrio ammonificans HB-1]|uniref:Uncharacterized protein n=1 Tax=Thermovibrio ammonificans (strain DSM 15698 / JCM 12110 / HB-1) TaxID=648996 RepID=E8T310_THEA1|nr:hypothetical protein [Thermovibrio ammonificans]ADU96015.1 hypothetical protein Theam_0041 [Thermovibrio ammonificans HB-1]